MMEKRGIGSLEVSAVGLGCNNFGTRLDEQGTARVVHAALDAGITLAAEWSDNRVRCKPAAAALYAGRHIHELDQSGE